jgi:hypothetical protein
MRGDRCEIAPELIASMLIGPWRNIPPGLKPTFILGRLRHD